MTTATLERDASGLLPLWRAAQVFRLASLAYAGAVQWTVVDNYVNRTLSWVVFALMLVWSGTAGTLLAFGHRHRARIVAADVVVTLLLMASTLLVGGHNDYFSRHQTVPTTFWAANAVVSVAILLGPWWGVGAAALIGLSALAIVDQLDNLSFDATLPILLTVGLAVGMGSQIVRRARERLDRAIRLEAAATERERLAREVHDTTLQVLAFVRRRGAEIGGPTTELATLAGDQEDALRKLLSRQADVSRVDQAAPKDLRSRLEQELPTDVSIAAPSHPMVLPEAVTNEIVAVVRAAVDNTRKHAGPGARSFVLLEDDGAQFVVTVRDDGVGFDPARLAEAEAEGRMGVSKSIRGRMTSIGGTVDLFAQPGEGTEWELHIPLEGTNRA
ncbi:MacS family sensor histidine kinase [Calidifontibacter indicus]|uniref:MacS family sensor histidine kinase n=1 Tax=Calidifontibacter indicus TaxID=419650 RepID=UPI003D71522E